MRDVLISVLVAGVASVITFLVAWGSRRARDRRLNRKYSIAGRFVTEYEDKIDGDDVVMKGLTTLTQHGRDVMGETFEFSDSRSWTLSGRLEPGGFIHGIYGAEDPHDSGTGTFFLKVAGREGDLEGLWAGYDSVNGGIAGGKYVFRRCPAVSFRHAVPEDAHRVCSLLGDALGELYIELDAVHTMIMNDPRSTCLVAESPDNHLLGALTVGLVKNDELASSFPYGQGHLAETLRVRRFNEHLGLVKSIAIDPHHRRRGLATDLVKRGLDWLSHGGATAAVCIGWKSERGCHIQGVMGLTGFEPVREVDQFWTEESKRERYECPACGGECHCSAVIFTRGLDSAELAVLP